MIENPFSKHKLLKEKKEKANELYLSLQTINKEIEELESNEKINIFINEIYLNRNNSIIAIPFKKTNGVIMFYYINNKGFKTESSLTVKDFANLYFICFNKIIVDDFLNRLNTLAFDYNNKIFNTSLFKKTT